MYQTVQTQTGIMFLQNNSNNGDTLKGEQYANSNCAQSKQGEMVVGIHA